jgi:CP family cyanate transporter-like MFS transporter
MPEPPAAAVTARIRARRRTWTTALFVAGVLGLGFNMRSAVTSLPPIFPELAGDLNLSSAAVAALASAPVLCFGVFSALAAPLSRRFGEERVLLAALVLLTAGLLLRGALPGLMLFPGTVLAAAAIAFLNVLLPSLVKRRRPDRAGWLIGSYLLCLSAGAILSSLIAVPVLQATGSVPVALGLWALPAIAAALLWLPQWRFKTLPPGTPPPGTGQAGAAGAAGPGRLKVSRYLLAWQVMGFMGLQSLTYYAALSWLPILLRDRGASAEGAGTLLGLMNFGNAVAALLIPVIAHRVRDQRALVAVIVAIATGGMLGVWLAPLAGALGWTMLLGLGQGAALGLAIYLMTARAPDPVTAASLSGFAQGAGYLVATAGPLLIGLLHTATGSWTVPVLVLLVMFGGELITGWSAARDKTLPQAWRPAREERIR